MEGAGGRQAVSEVGGGLWGSASTHPQGSEGGWGQTAGTAERDPRRGPSFPSEGRARGSGGLPGPLGRAVPGNKWAGQAMEVVTGSDSGWDLDRRPTGRTCFQMEQEARKGGIKARRAARKADVAIWCGRRVREQESELPVDRLWAAGHSGLDLRAGQRSYAV